MRKNIDLKSGISFFSWIVFSILASWHLGAGPTGSAEIPARQYEYELQFMNTDLEDTHDLGSLRDIGIGKIIVRTFQSDVPTGGLFFKNSFFKVLHPSLDRISTVFKARQTGLDLWAWMLARKFNWNRETKYFDYEYIRAGNPGSGRRMVKKFDLFNPDAVDMIVGVFRELAARDIQGILIQDDLFLRYNEGVSNWGKAKFTITTRLPFKENLVLQSGTPYNRQWIDIKINQVNQVLTRIIKACKTVNPDIRVGMNIYYETPIFIKRSEHWYAHNLEAILETGLDFIYLMTYHRQIKREMKTTEAQNRQLFRQIVDKAYKICGDKLIVKLQIRDWDNGERIPVQELREYRRLIPPEVKRVCLTPVTPDDFGYIAKFLHSLSLPAEKQAVQ